GDLDNLWDSARSNSGIYFGNNTFDKICCSLLISYLKTPQFLLKEFFRVLKPNGKIIISSLKPYADLSQIYYNFTSQTKNRRELERARKLLSDAGIIKQKESQGYYQFYSEKELIQLLKKTSFKNIKCYRAFGNQANIAFASK
ncbi:MAG: methyltransferase domain-containing protein, partial [Nitrospirae bacterium]|nr:methyltransferase domain-containing protein [Nitrospirota bacterium]